MSATDALSDLGQAQLRIDEELKVLRARGLDDDSMELKVQDRFYELEDILAAVTQAMTRLTTWVEGATDASER